MVRIVPEAFRHAAAREALLDAAFGPARFLKTCERLREDRLPAEGLAFSALLGGRLVGTLRLWHVAAGDRSALMLGPLAVDGQVRGLGIGSQMICHALAQAKRLGHRAVILVGDAPYYARFGFSTDLVEELTLPGPVERARFLGLELAPDGLTGARGMVEATGELVGAQAMAA